MVSIGSHVMYTGAKTVVRTVYGNSNGFEVKVSMHQGSALSPLLLVIVMEALSREFRVALPWELLYTDDLVVIAETEDDLIKNLNEQKDFVENGHVVYVAEVLVIIQYSVLVVRSGYTRNVVV